MISEAIYLHYMNALLDGDKNQCSKIIHGLVEQRILLKEIYLDLFQRSMYRIGQLWEKDRCSIGDEHIATKITESLIDLTTSLVESKEQTGKKIVIACIDKEYHELGAKMVAGFFEVNGWESIFLGSCTPTNEILNVIKNKNPHVVGISINFYINVARLAKLIKMIRNDFPDIKIIIGGQAVASIDKESLKQYKVEYIPTLTDLETYIDNYNSSINN